MRFFWKRQKGNVFLLLLVAMTVGGLAASQLFPNYAVTSQRNSEENLGLTLQEIRRAMQLERLADPRVEPNTNPDPRPNASDSLFFTDLSKPTNLRNYLEQLVQRNYLSRVSIDPTSQLDQWGDTKRLYWLATRNYVASSGFETNDLLHTRWATGSNNLTATVTSSMNLVWPGGALGWAGHSLVLVKP